MALIELKGIERVFQLGDAAVHALAGLGWICRPIAASATSSVGRCIVRYVSAGLPPV